MLITDRQTDRRSSLVTATKKVMHRSYSASAEHRAFAIDILNVCSYNRPTSSLTTLTDRQTMKTMCCSKKFDNVAELGI